MSRSCSASRCTAPIRDLLPFGTKTGCRRLFAAADVLHPLGREDIRDVDGLVDALVEMRAKRPAMRYAIVKLNDGVSGRGNATVDLAELRLRARRRARRAPPADRGDGVRAARHHARGLPRAARERRRHRGGAGRGRRAAQPERATARDTARPGRAAVDARPAPRWPERPEVPRLPVPRGLRVRAGDQPRGGEDRRGARAGGGPRPLRGRLRRRPRRRAAPGRRTRSRSTSARAARRTRSSRSSS